MMNQASILSNLRELSATIAVAEDPLTVWRATEDLCRDVFGFVMFTVLEHLPETGEVRRLYSTRPDTYPAGGRKIMGATPWGELVLQQGETFLGEDHAAVRWAYPDHETLFLMGIGSAINFPMRLGGRTLGTLNLTAPAGHYRSEHVQTGPVLAAIVTPALFFESRNCTNLINS